MSRGVNTGSIHLMVALLKYTDLNDKLPRVGVLEFVANSITKKKEFPTNLKITAA